MAGCLPYDLNALIIRMIQCDRSR